MYPHTWLFISDLRYGCWAYRKMRMGGHGTLGVAWRVRSSTEVVAVQCGGWRGGRRSTFSRVWLVRLACLVYIATYVVVYAKSRTQDGHADSRAEREDSGHPLRYYSRSIVCSITSFPTSLVYCDSYEMSYRTIDSTACWKIPLAISRKTCMQQHSIAHPLLCWCIQSSLWRAG